MRRRLGFIQAFLAREEDFFFIPDNAPDCCFYRLHSGKILGVSAEEAVAEITAIQPWGWNRSLRHTLVEAGLPASLMPDDLQLAKIKQLAHRRTTIPVLEELSSLLRCPHLFLPIEIADEHTLDSYLDASRHLFLKYPWSSSGRGVFDLSAITRSQIKEIAAGGFRRQGSVMLEQAYEVTHNYATEWECRDAKARYIGLSHFISTGRNNYSGNVAESQQQLKDNFNSLAQTNIDEIVKAQKQVIEKLIGPHYEGMLGIDMFILRDGSVHPCVEINLRMTMGHIAIACERSTGFKGTLTLATLEHLSPHVCERR